MTVSTRLVTLDDVPAVSALYLENLEFLRPFEPVRAEGYFEPSGQREVIGTALERHDRGECVPHVILLDDRIVGRINLNDIVRGPFLNSHLGYWVSQDVNGRGVASAAVTRMIQVAFEEQGLHRIQAGTLRHNIASQKVLARHGFVQFGLAEKYLQIAGVWQDHILFQLLAHDRP
ncbi:GNAT family N-acetyltransferase [Catellatospora chokoriensis]|uniref:Putative ribosomal-protein-alanine acetyltransferase n=1 Tax=Catellatospora chokoriensis TaxID=310353 RepID=A0A8J3NPI9_9ACTN|nr:GNAT family N-acetyltransferase [Catellatospora chokoriensis]GIF88227.1 putative ribosomal-protein-alanine acetyltransferase [Catellatospora chokoriensis]